MTAARRAAPSAGSTPTATSAVIEVDTTGATALAWSDAEPGVGDIVFGWQRRHGPGPRHGRHGLGRRADLPGPGWLSGSAAASSTRRRSRPARPVGRSSIRPADSSGSTRTGSARASISPAPADAALRASVEALGRESISLPRRDRRRAVVRREAPARPVGLADRDGPGPRRRGRQPGRSCGHPGVRPARRGGRPTLDEPDVLPEILAEVGLPIELKIVRGDEERTISVGGTSDVSRGGLSRDGRAS